MSEKKYNLTIYETIALQVLALFRNKTGKGCLNRDAIFSDKELTGCILEAVEWYEKTSSAEIDDSSFYPYIKMVNEIYLEVVKSDAFLSSYTDGFRKCLIECFEKN